MKQNVFGSPEIFQYPQFFQPKNNLIPIPDIKLNFHQHLIAELPSNHMHQQFLHTVYV